MTPPLKVGVVFGGRSVEHDVSIVTAHQAMDVLAARHEVVPIYITKDGEWLAGQRLFDLDVYKKKTWRDAGEIAVIPPLRGFGGLLLLQGRRRPKKLELDVVVPAVHGTFGEDGTLQGLLELADLPYTGSGVVASAVGMDKVAMKAAFRAAGLPVVEDVSVDAARFAAAPDAVVREVEDRIGYPAFVKPVRAGSSVGIAKASDRDGLLEAIKVALRYDHRLLVERAMEGCIEVNCSVVGGVGSPARASVCEQPVPWQEFLSFQDKYMRASKGSKSPEGMASQERRIPAPIPEEVTKQVQTNALTAFDAIGASGVVRVDSFVREETGETWVMEINTMPGSFGFYLWEASGTTFTQLMDELIAIAQATHRAKQDLLFTFDSGLLEAGRGGKTGG